MPELELVPVSFSEAKVFIIKNHRHHIPPQGHKFSVAVAKDGKVVGVVCVGRPVSRVLDDRWTLEVTRCCTDGTPNANSKLYGAAWRVARNLGYKKLITYTLESESGVSLRAAGFEIVGQVRGRSWSCKSRPRVDKHPTVNKIRWAKELV